MTDDAPTFMLNRPPAFRTRSDLSVCMGILFREFTIDMKLDSLGYGVRAGEDTVFPEPKWLMATDSNELSDDRIRWNPTSPRQGNQPADGLGLARGTSACLPHGVEKLKQPLLILVDGHIQGPASRGHLIGLPRQDRGTFPLDSLTR